MKFHGSWFSPFPYGLLVYRNIPGNSSSVPLRGGHSHSLFRGGNSAYMPSWTWLFPRKISFYVEADCESLKMCSQESGVPMNGVCGLTFSAFIGVRVSQLRGCFSK